MPAGEAQATENTPKTRRERVEQRENAIVAAAHDAFVDMGFEGARMADIARAAKVAEGTLYLYFKNKNALLDAVVGRFYERLTEAAQDGVQDRADTFACLEFLARHHLVSCIREWRILELVVSRYRNVQHYQDRGPYQLNRRYVAIFDSIVSLGMQRRDIDPSLPLWMVRDLFYGTLEYAARTQILRGEQANIAIVIGSLMSMLRSGIVPRGQAAVESVDLEQVSRRLEQVAARLENTT